MAEEKLLIVLRSLSLIRLTKYLCQDVTVSRTACTFIYGTGVGSDREEVRRCRWKVVQESDVWCGLCRGPALRLVQSTAHPSPLHLVPDADRLHCTTADLSHVWQETNRKARPYRI